MNDYLPQRVVSLQPSTTSTMDSLGLLDRLVACTRHCALVVPCVKSASVAIVEDSWTAETEQIVAAKPDLVLASVPYQAEAIAQILSAGVRVLTLSPRSLNDVYGDIATIANLMGVPERGDKVIGSMQQELECVRTRTSNRQKVRVYCEEWGKPIMLSQPWVAELVEAAGGLFVGDPGKTISAAEIVEADPEVIVFAWCGAGDRVPMEKLVSERGWQDVRAVRDSRVFAIRDEFLTTPGPPLTTGLAALAHAIQPEAFLSRPTAQAGTKVMRRLRESVVK